MLVVKLIFLVLHFHLFHISSPKFPAFSRTMMATPANHRPRGLPKGRSVIARETIEVMRNNGYYTNDGIWTHHILDDMKTTYYSPLLDLDISQVVRLSFPTTIEFTHNQTIREVQMSPTGHTVVLNFASAKNPGGGFESDAQAQEESICRRSTLHASINGPIAASFYDVNRRVRAVYTNAAIYSENVVVFRDDNAYADFLDEPLVADFVTVAAVNVGALGAEYDRDPVKYRRLIKSRINRVLATAAISGGAGKKLILGAFGCGVFRSPPEIVAGYFHELLMGKYANIFLTVTFAIPNDYMFEIFSEAFSQPLPWPNQEPLPVLVQATQYRATDTEPANHPPAKRLPPPPTHDGPPGSMLVQKGPVPIRNPSASSSTYQAPRAGPSRDLPKAPVSTPIQQPEVRQKPSTDQWATVKGGKRRDGHRRD